MHEAQFKLRRLHKNSRVPSLVALLLIRVGLLSANGPLLLLLAVLLSARFKSAVPCNKFKNAKGDKTSKGKPDKNTTHRTISMTRGPGKRKHGKLACTLLLPCPTSRRPCRTASWSRRRTSVSDMGSIHSNTKRLYFADPFS